MKKRNLSLLISASALAAAAIVIAGTVEVGTLKTDTAKVGVITPLPPEHGLVLYLPFETDKGGIVMDASGNGHNGSILGCTWTNAGYFAGGAMSFTNYTVFLYLGYYPYGVIKFSTVPDFPSWGTYSVSVWFKDDGYNSYPVILEKSSLWSISLSYGAVCWKMGTGSTYCNLSVGSYGEYKDGKWHHVAVVRNGTSAQLWVDGKLRNSSNNAVSASSSSNFCVGNTASADLNYIYGGWVGLIDEVRIYDRALSPAAIGQLHREGLLVLPSPVTMTGDLTVGGNLTVTGAVNFVNGARWLKPSGDLKQGNFTTSP